MQNDEIYSDLLDGLGIAMAKYDADLRAVRWNATFLKFFPEHVGFIRSGEHYADNLRRFYGARLEGDDLKEIELMVAEGVQRHLAQLAPFEFLHHGRRLQVNSAPTPTGARIRMSKELEARPAPASTGTPAFDSLENIADGACILDANGTILVANAQFRELYDVAEAEVIVGRRIDEVIAQAWGVGEPVAAMRAAIRNGLRYDNAPFEIELPHDRWRRVIMRHADADHAYLVHSDSTGSRRKERELNRLANVDALTGLINRRGLAEYLSQAQPAVSLLAIDIDHFKRLNDVWGHVAGDSCLKRVALALQDFAECTNSLACRLGGEEFVVVLSPRADDELRALADKIRMMIAGSGSPPVTVSIGAATGDQAEVIEAADAALYLAKRNGRNRAEVGSCRRVA